MYVRKTANATELSEARRRAAFARKVHRGGRKRKPENDLPAKTVRIAARDYAIFAAYAAEKRLPLKEVMHRVAGMIVYGGQSAKHPSYIPDGWEL